MTSFLTTWVALGLEEILETWCIVCHDLIDGCKRCSSFCPGVIESIAVSAEGALLCSVGDDQAMKVFDVVNFDMINMLKLGWVWYTNVSSLDSFGVKALL